jgi:mono/diheme cytochrome c family protein
MNTSRPRIRFALGLTACALLTLAAVRTGRPTAAREPEKDIPASYPATVRPLVEKYCLGCHSTKAKKGSLDLERFATLDDVRKDVKVWQGVIEQLEAGEMPPKDKPQPTAEEKKQLLAWVRTFLDAEARARSGDPGYVPLRRLSNAEYNYTVRDLTGVDLQPAREFPADGAAGEGFTNAAEALADISPALLTKYLNAAKDISEHAVLLPDGFRFSHSKTRRDWTDEGTAALRKFYAALAPADGKLPVQPYLLATVRHRGALAAGKLDEVAAKERLNAKYLRALWDALADKTPSHPLDSIRAKWRTAAEKDVPALAADVVAWQAALWRTVRVGSYVQAKWGETKGGYVESLARQVPVDPPAVEVAGLRLAVKPTPGQSEVTLYLSAREAASGTMGGIVWHRPRFEALGKPTLLLSDYDKFGAAFEVDYPAVFTNSATYLAATVELANDKKLTVEDAAKKHGLDAAFLKRWSEVLAVEPFERDAEAIGRVVPAVELTLLKEKTPRNDARPAINGWKKKGTDLPVLVTNSSDKAEQIPGRVPAKGVGVHPMPKEFVAVVWTAPVACTVKVSAKITHAHPACGNGVAWWLEHRRGNRAAVFGEGAVDLGGEATAPVKTLKVEKGDQIILAVDAKDENHVCDMTAIEFGVSQTEKPERVWNLAADIATTVHAGNPHDDNHGHKAVWSFVRGPSRPIGKSISNVIPPQSLLGQWREAASDSKRKDEAAKLAEQVQTLLSGKRPAQEKSPDRVLYDNLVGVESTLFTGVDLAKLAKPQAASFGLPKEKFTDANLVAPSGKVIEVKLPAALFVGREFVVDAKLGGPAADRLVRPRVATAAPGSDARGDGPLLGSATSAAYKQLVAGHAEFRRVFPLYTCFPQVVPTDEVVSLKMFHREDEPLERLFLSDAEKQKLDRLWVEQRFVSRQPVAEWDYLPQFMGYTTQDTPKEFQQFFIDRKPLFKKHADEFLKDEEAAIPKQLDALFAFAEKAYRRPLQEKERGDLLTLYKTIRGKGAAHDEAFRGVLARVLVSPAFLFRIEQAPKGKEPGPVNDWELATRLSYFLWSSLPDDELRALAAAGKLRDPKVLAAQTQRMLKDARTRALAIEFGTQWIHVRGFDEHNEKNEKLFPTFTPELRKAIYEESILFFLDLFQNDRAVTSILDADHTYLNETLAKHYGIPGVSGREWRKVDGVRKYGRGGVLGLASVQAKQAGASRTSPVLRGNWVVETLLGEKLPRPPANVPQLPEEEGADKLTVRQQVERHAKEQSCAVCHVRIDPFGFALEKYDPIGRLREKDLGGLAIDAKSKLKDGTEFEGIDGLRTYLLTKKKDVVVRLFCRRLLGYALGRSVTLSDTTLIDEMVSELERNGGKVSAVVQVIVKSPQFRMVRGSEFSE